MIPGEIFLSFPTHTLSTPSPLSLPTGGLRTETQQLLAGSRGRRRGKGGEGKYSNTLRPVSLGISMPVLAQLPLRQKRQEEEEMVTMHWSR